MESNNEIEPTNKDSVSDSGLSGTDRLPLVIDNFEHFPAEILLPIFAATDDIDLLHLASVSVRFEPMVREVFAERYADKYFVIEEETEDHQHMCSPLLSFFGDSIRAIEANGVRNIDNNHWLLQMLNKHTPNLEKLCFRKCSFKNIDLLLSQHIDITHLAFRSGSCEENYCIQLPEYRNLKSFELFGFSHIIITSLKRVFCNNPQIERLVLSVRDNYFTFPNIMELIHAHLKHLKELNIMEWFDNCYEPFIPITEIVQFVSVLTCLESFGLSICSRNSLNLLERVCSSCTNIKRLELCDYYNNHYTEMLEIFCTLSIAETFAMVNSSLEQYCETMMENLPNLRGSSSSVNIYISKEHFNNAELLEVIHKCKHLKRYFVKTEYYSRYYMDYDDVEVSAEDSFSKNLHFHNEFIKKAKKNPNIRMEFREKGKVTGVVTKEEIIWRNKLLHWVGHDPIYSRSNVRLLDLGNVSEGTHKQPLNFILNYLDLESVYSFAMTSEKSKQLAYKYIQLRCKPPPKKCTEQRALQRGKFYVTDEFSEQFEGLEMFGKGIKHLEVNLFDYYHYEVQAKIAKNCKILTTLCLRTRQYIDMHRLTLPKVRHITFYGCGENHTWYYDLSHVSQECPNLEVLEIGIVAEIPTGNIENPILKKIEFKPPADPQVKIVKKLRSVTKVYINNAFKYVRQYR